MPLLALKRLKATIIPLLKRFNYDPAFKNVETFLLQFTALLKYTVTIGSLILKTDVETGTAL